MYVVLQFASKASDDILFTNYSLHELEDKLKEGPTRDAHCMGCGSFTAGEKCEECIPGHFRGTEDLRAPCRPYVSSLCLTLIH